MKSIKIEKSEIELLVRYMPSYNYDAILKSIHSDGALIKNTFRISERNLIEYNDNEEYIVFRIAKAVNDYFVLDKEVFGLKRMICIEKNLNIQDAWFVSSPRTSIFSIIDELLTDDLYIVENNDGTENHVPVKDFLNLIGIFPNSYEKEKYARARIAYLLSNYVEGMWRHKESYDNYLEKKELSLSIMHDYQIKLIGYDMYKKAAEELEEMLKNPLPYSETVWQQKIKEIVCVLYPKYIASFREIEIGNDGRHSKKPDFILVDSSGFVDILEIKKPNDQKVVSSSEYRNNYVAGRDLEGAIVQIEKYMYILNHEGENRVRIIRNQIAHNLPIGIEIKVINPQGILLLGRSTGLSKDQLYDFEIIKRQHKNIVDIMTYDDLLNRLKNILAQMDSDKESNG